MIFNNLTIQELVHELKAQDQCKRDIVISANNLKMESAQLLISSPSYLDGLNTIFPNIPAHRQISDKLNIPWKYYQRCMNNNAKHQNVLDSNINAWLSSDDRKFLIRTFDEGDYALGRAFLSNSYKPIDNLDILFSVLDAIKTSNIEVNIQTADISETNLYVRFIIPNSEIATDLVRNYKNPKSGDTGDGIINGFILKNSETGHGKFSLSPRAYIKICGNGMISDKNVFSVTHLGAKLSEGIWSEKTHRNNTRLIKSQITDWISYHADNHFFNNWISELEKYGNVPVEHPVDTVKNVTQHFNLNEKAQNNILDYFIKSTDYRAIGVTHAITYFAHQQEDPDLRNDLEMKSIKILPAIKNYDKIIK